jgi:hypothetical protein
VAQRRLDIALLLPLRAAAQQNDKHLAVPAEVDSIAGAAIDGNSATPSPIGFAFEVLPSPSRSIAIVTRAAA